MAPVVAGDATEMKPRAVTTALMEMAETTTATTETAVTGSMVAEEMVVETAAVAETVVGEAAIDHASAWVWLDRGSAVFYIYEFYTLWLTFDGSLDDVANPGNVVLAFDHVLL